jgi:hypothetical protein
MEENKQQPRPLVNISVPDDVDDKNLVIFSVFVLCLVAMLLMGADALSTVENGITGLFGVAVGRATKGGTV